MYSIGAAYIDYQDDGQIFNGSVAWYDYLGAAVLGGVIGGLIGYSVAPMLVGLLTSTGVISGSLAFAGGLGSIGGTIAISAIGEIALVVTVVATGASAFGVTVMFASDYRPGNNKVQNKQFEKAAKSAGYDPKDPEVKDMLKEIHQYIRKNNLNLGWKELVKLIKEWFN